VNLVKMLSRPGFTQHISTCKKHLSLLVKS
jgi:hypothetical protein